MVNYNKIVLFCILISIVSINSYDYPTLYTQIGYTIEQAISDGAQQTTIAFGGLGFITGNSCADTFLPPGDVADFFGFQYFRDNAPNGVGHNTDFLTNCANNVLALLTDAQKDKMYTLAYAQAEDYNQFAWERFPIIFGFRDFLTDKRANGSQAKNLSEDAVTNYFGKVYELDARICIERAKLFNEIILSFNETQISKLNAMISGGFSSWPAINMQAKHGLTQNQNTLVMTFASEIFSYYAGTMDSDAYFAPERNGNYFGGIYIKDAAAVGNPGYQISTSATSDKGNSFLNTLTNVQKQEIYKIIPLQKQTVQDMVYVRRNISNELRKGLNNKKIDENKVISLDRSYGKMDGYVSYLYASAFGNIAATLTADQQNTLQNVRDLNIQCEDAKVYYYSIKQDKPNNITVVDLTFATKLNTVISSILFFILICITYFF